MHDVLIFMKCKCVLGKHIWIRFRFYGV